MVGDHRRSAADQAPQELEAFVRQAWLEDELFVKSGVRELINVREALEV